MATETITLRARSNAKSLAQICNNYGTALYACCTVGGFICPFAHQDANGSWTIDKDCRNVAPSDWERILKDGSQQA